MALKAMGRRIGWLSLLAAAVLFAADRKLELHGRIEPPPGKFCSVTLDGYDFPYAASMITGPGGRFRFKNLDPGTYTLYVFLPGRGEVRRTVSITPSLADEKGRVKITVPFEVSGAALEAAGTVSAKELTIPKKARAEYQKARKKLNRRDTKGAIQHLKRAVEIAPGFVTAWNELGTIAYREERYQDAERYFRTALEHEPGAYSPTVNLGGVLLTLGRYKEALRYNEYALRLRPDEALPNSQLGLNWAYLGDEDKAIEYLKKAKQIDPNHFSHPQMMLAKLYARRGEDKRALQELKDFLARHPDSPNAQVARGWVEVLEKRLKKK